MSTVICPNCDQANPDVTRICRYCGASLSAREHTARPVNYAPAPPPLDWLNSAPLAPPVQPYAPPPATAADAPMPYAPPALLRHAGATDFRCPHCQTPAPPIIARRISTAGWIVFFSLLVFCFPFCFVGLFIKEEYRMCSWCRAAVA